MTDETVQVRRHPQDWQTAVYKLQDIEGLHWDIESGGVQHRTSHPTVFGYVMCDGMVSGEVAHSCAHGPPPHRIKVCLPKTHNKPAWKAVELALEASGQPTRANTRRGAEVSP